MYGITHESLMYAKVLMVQNSLKLGALQPGIETAHSEMRSDQADAIQMLAKAKTLPPACIPLISRPSPAEGCSTARRLWAVDLDGNATVDKKSWWFTSDHVTFL